MRLSEAIPIVDGPAGTDCTYRASVVSQVERIAQRAPGATAVCDGSTDVTYLSLCRSADRLAAKLTQAGVANETLVGICLPRSCDRIVAMLAVWKAGGAVLALDPSWPPERLRALLASAQVGLVLAPDLLAAELAVSGRIVVSGADWPDLPAQMAPAPDAHPADALAYVIYTSGSSGVPKGVEITHRNLAHLVSWHQAAFSLSAADRVSHVAGLGFDASFWEVWPALCGGATVVLADEAVRTSPELLQRWLLDHAITVAFVPTVLAELMIVAGWPQDAALRLLLTGGEALRRRPRPALPFAVINNYGPSECTVVATSGPVAPDAGTDLPDIGWPIAGTHIHILDESGRPVRDGEAGEIVIGGGGVGRGYRNQPELTRERFVPDAFCREPGRFLYRSGDIGRRLPDGRIAFLGRNDSQEQIRGSRVEPAEVASVLGRHPSVGWCTVVGDGPPHARRLVAYVMPPGGTPNASGEALRGFLAALLPEAMIPSVFIPIDRLPLSANGKLDLAALPPACLAPTPAAGRALSTPVQVRLAEIIGDLLGVSVGADDDFFLLGGHSLLGTQVVVRAREAFGVNLSLRDLFQAPTVAALSERVAELLVEQLDAMTDEEASLWAAT